MVTVLEEVRAELSRESYVPCLTGTEPYKKVHILAAQHADMLLALADAAAELPTGYLYSLARDLREHRGWPDQIQLADAVKVFADALEPLLAESATGTEGQRARI